MLVANDLRGLKRSYSCSIICVGSLSSSPISRGAETSAVKGHAPYSSTAATLTLQISSTKKSPTTNCSLVTIESTIGSSPSYTMCYFNLQWSERWLLVTQDVRMACQKVCKPSRDGIKVKVNVQSPILASFFLH